MIKDKLSGMINSKYFILILFLLILTTRFVFLDADPSFVKRVSDISDETVWGLDARNAIIFNDWFIGDLHVGLDSAPLYMYLLYLFFKVFGPSLFALRLLPAISGSLTAILLYYFVKKQADKKHALLALCLFGFGNVVVVYNRLGHLESTLSLFLLAFFMLWYFGKRSDGKERKLYYFTSGIFYSLAILIKFSAILFFPALVVYWYFELKKEELSLGRFIKRFIYFGLGGIIPIILYLFLFLIPYWNQISKSLITHGQNNFFGLTFAINSFKILGNNLFGLPSFVIMFFLFIFYLIWKLNQMEKFSLGELIKNSTSLELISLSWIIGGLLGILISDVSDRRFTIMFVPIVILIAHLVFNFKDFSFKEFFTKISSGDYKSGIFSKLSYYTLLFFPAFSLPYLVLRLMGKNSILFKQGSIIILILYVITILLAFVLVGKIILPKLKMLFHKLLFFQSIFFLIFDPLTTLIRHFSKHFSIIFSLIPLERMILIGTTGIVFVLLGVCSLLIFRKENFILKKKYLTLSVFSYFFISIILIGIVVFFPSFTIMDGVRDLAEVTEPGTLIMGAASEEFVYGTELLYLKYEPYHRSFSKLNQDIWDYNPRYYMDAKIFDGKKELIPTEVKIFEKIKEDYEVKFIMTLKFYRYPFTNVYKSEFDLYELEVKSGEENSETNDGMNDVRNDENLIVDNSSMNFNDNIWKDFGQSPFSR